jgi:hypothetical protein
VNDPAVEFIDEPMAGEYGEVHEDDSYAVTLFHVEYRAWPPAVSEPRIQACPTCGEDCREDRRDLWHCEGCGQTYDLRPLIRPDMPRRRRKARKRETP